MSEKKYIELDEAKRIMKANDWLNPAIPNVVNVILDRLPAADAVEVVHANWIDRDGKTWCSACGASNKQYKPPYCPHCGAKMDGGENDGK